VPKKRYAKEMGTLYLDDKPIMTINDFRYFRYFREIHNVPTRDSSGWSQYTSGPRDVRFEVFGSPVEGMSAELIHLSGWHAIGEKLVNRDHVRAEIMMHGTHLSFSGIIESYELEFPDIKFAMGIIICLRPIGAVQTSPAE